MKKTKLMPRGIRNNNPGNIEAKSANMWKGADGDDGRFIKFTEVKWGIRAIAVLLTNYQLLHKLNTIEGVINRWAPPVENDTGSYVDVVAASVGTAPNEPIDVSDASVMLPLVKAIITVENGQQPYADAVILEALKLAGIDNAKKIKPLEDSRTLKGVVIAGIGQVLELLQSNPEIVALAASLFGPEAAVIVPKVITFVGLAYAAYARIDDHNKGVK